MLGAISHASSLEGVPSSLASARDGIDSVLRDRGLRRIAPEQTMASLLEGAVATAALEGDAVTSDELVAGGGGHTARAALRLMTELPMLIPIWRRSPIQVLARIHAVAAEGSLSAEELGRPASSEGRDRLDDLMRLYAEDTAAPALGVAAYLHAGIACAGAFASHNAVVARAVERLVLVARGLDPACVLVPETAHLRYGERYRSSLSAFADGDVHSWMLYAAEAAPQFVSLSPLVLERTSHEDR